MTDLASGSRWYPGILRWVARAPSLTDRPRPLVPQTPSIMSGMCGMRRTCCPEDDALMHTPRLLLATVVTMVSAAVTVAMLLKRPVQ